MMRAALTDQTRSWLTTCFLWGAWAAPSTVAGDPLKIVAFGDSTTAPRANVVVYAEILGKHFGDRVLVINKGVPGNTTAAALDRFQRDVVDEKPAVVIVQFGINDAAVDVWRSPPQTAPRVKLADYEVNVRKFVRESQAAGAKVILMTPNQLRWTPKLLELYGHPPYDPEDERGFNVVLKNYAEVVRSVAHQEGAGLIDPFALYDSWETNGGGSCADLLLDGMHPNSRGHALVAHTLQRQVLQALAAGRSP